MTKTLRARVWPLLTLSALAIAASRPAAAQASEDRTAVDRLQHPSGTQTGKAGIAHVERRGQGPVPVVLIAGAPFGWRAWQEFMARNEARYTMFAVTPAGYDDTPPPAMPDGERADHVERAWTEALMSDLVKLLDDEIAPKFGPAVVVGHHLMGDYYAVRLAAEHPKLVRGVVSVAGQGSVPMSADHRDAAARASYVRDNRAPFFRTVSQETWNANTFRPNRLSIDPDRGGKLFEEQIAVPIATQVRYYLEYMTDQVEPRLQRVQVPILSLEQPSGQGPDIDNLPQSMKDQLIKRFGSLEQARNKVQMASSPWSGFASLVKPGLLRKQEIAKAAIFMMQDAPEDFDAALAGFVAGLETATPPTTEKGGEEHDR